MTSNDPVTFRGHKLGQTDHKGHRDDPEGHGDLCDQFNLVYDPKRSRGYKKSP